MRTQQPLITSLLALVMATGTVMARPLDTDLVSADARWVAHLDAATLRGTQLGRYLLTAMSTDQVERQMAAFEAIFRFDPREDLDAVTLFGGMDEQNAGVVLVQGRFDTDQLVTLVQANPDYDSQVHGTRIIHSWIDEKKPGKRTFGCVIRNDLLVMGDQNKLIKHAVDVLEGRARSMKDAPALPGLADSVDAAFFIGSADMANMPNLDPKAAILRQNEAVSLSLREVGNEVMGHLRMVAKNVETATAVQAIAQGLASLIQIDPNQDAVAASLARSMQMTLRGKEIDMRLSLPVQQTIRMLEKQAEQKRASEAEKDRPNL